MAKTIKEFLNKDYKDYSLYTIENRAIPSVIDGFKPTARKIVHCSINTWKNGAEKPLKVFQLAGKIAHETFYHHGPVSLEGAIITLAQKFKNNLSLFEELGQFGSLRSPQPGASRYIGTKLNKNFSLVYKDNNLLEHKIEEGETIEPKYFLPIIPMVLVNGSSGIAVGFASNILNRNPLDIIEACLNVLSGKKVKDLIPFINGFTGEFTTDPLIPKRWIIKGKYHIENTTTVKIMELPPAVTYERYEQLLDNMCDNKFIVSYTDNCKDNIDYEIKLKRERLSTLKHERLMKKLRLEESETENFTTLDEHGKLKIFDCAEDIVKYFVDFRLRFYAKRKAFLLNKLEHELLILSNRTRFIKMIINKEMVINNRKKESIVKDLIDFKFDKVDDSYDYLLKMPIYALTKELADKLVEDHKSKQNEHKELLKREPKEMYVADLKELKSNLK